MISNPRRLLPGAVAPNLRDNPVLLLGVIVRLLREAIVTLARLAPALGMTLLRRFGPLAILLGRWVGRLGVGGLIALALEFLLHGRELSQEQAEQKASSLGIDALVKGATDESVGTIIVKILSSYPDMPLALVKSVAKRLTAGSNQPSSQGSSSGSSSFNATISEAQKMGVQMTGSVTGISHSAGAASAMDDALPMQFRGRDIRLNGTHGPALSIEGSKILAPYVAVLRSTLGPKGYEALIVLLAEAQVTPSEFNIIAGGLR